MPRQMTLVAQSPNLIQMAPNVGLNVREIHAKDLFYSISKNKSFEKQEFQNLLLDYTPSELSFAFQILCLVFFPNAPKPHFSSHLVE